jgi:4-diphosphocytidyl-2-C-methyl-D-erythritol kinase
MIRERAPAKVNLLLHVGPRRGDGLHELCSLFASLELADELTVAPGGATDEVHCPAVPDDNLVQAAIRAFRDETEAALPPLRIEIDKRIPVAAGLGGGSADAAAALRAANELAGRPLDVPTLRLLGARVGADVPSQIEPRSALVTGAGERVEPLPLPDMALVLVPQQEGLATADVYARADRMGAARQELDPAATRALASAPLAELAAGLENDLQAAALALRPELEEQLVALWRAGALAALVTGSGPTVFGVFGDEESAARAARAVPGGLVSKVRTS